MLVIIAKEKTTKEKKGVWSSLCMQSGIEILNKGLTRRWILTNDLKEVIDLAIQESGGKFQAEQQQVEELRLEHVWAVWRRVRRLLCICSVFLIAEKYFCSRICIKDQ